MRNACHGRSCKGFKLYNNRMGISRLSLKSRGGFWHLMARIPPVRRGSLAMLAMRAMHAAEATEAAAVERNPTFCLVAVGRMTSTRQLFSRPRKRYKTSYCLAGLQLQVTRSYRLRRQS